jgi:uncharacterized protein (DUF362 family)
MKSISRRKLMKQAVFGIGGLSVSQILSGCAPQAATSAPIPAPITATIVPSVQSAPTEKPQPTVNGASASTPSPISTITSVPVSSPTVYAQPDMVVARGPEPEQIVRQAIKAMGGMEKFIKKGAKVIIKPNICVAYAKYENAFTTNPWVVGALVKLCLEAGAASVRVFDFPFNGPAAKAYIDSGIEAEVKKAGGEMIQWVGYKYVPTQIKQGKEIKNIGIFGDISDAILNGDAIINVPIPKHHSLAGMTLAMKNLLGVIDNRGSIHPNFGQRLVDLATLIKPVLNVVDAVRILKNNGPASGTAADVQKLDMVYVTTDIVAADAYGSTLFGKKPEDFKNVVIGAEMKLGRMDIANLKIEEIKVGG